MECNESCYLHRKKKQSATTNYVHMVIQCSKCKGCSSTAEFNFDQMNKACGCGGTLQLIPFDQRQ